MLAHEHLAVFSLADLCLLIRAIVAAIRELLQQPRRCQRVLSALLRCRLRPLLCLANIQHVIHRLLAALSSTSPPPPLSEPTLHAHDVGRLEPDRTTNDQPAVTPVSSPVRRGLAGPCCGLLPPPAPPPCQIPTAIPTNQVAKSTTTAHGDSTAWLHIAGCIHFAMTYVMMPRTIR